MTTTYYVPPASRTGDTLVLPPEEAKHATRVLRKRIGDEIEVVDGAGNWYRVLLQEISPKRTTVRILERQSEVGEPGYHLTIAIALLKNRNRFETFLEKATELGVSRILPLVTERTEKASLNVARCQKILIAAMKQCGRCRLPELAAPKSLTSLAFDPNVTSFIAHEKARKSEYLIDRLDCDVLRHPLIIFIGPEGGFSDPEIDECEKRGSIMVSLGPRRLRAETAAMLAASSVMMAASE